MSARPASARPPDSSSVRPKLFRTASASSESRLGADGQRGRGLKESRKQLIKRSRECERQPKTEQSKTHEKTTFYALLHVRRGKKGPIILATSVPGRPSKQCLINFPLERAQSYTHIASKYWALISSISEEEKSPFLLCTIAIVCFYAHPRTEWRG